MTTSANSPESVAPALEWVRRHGFAITSVDPLPGDVSLRRYYRLGTSLGQSVILATYPESIRETCERFQVTAALFTDVGVPIPEILLVDCDAGRMLVEDLGTTTLYDQRDQGWDFLASRLRKAVEIIARIGTIPADRLTTVNPALDHELLAYELDNTWRLTLGAEALGEAGLDGAADLDHAFGTMLRHLGEAPQAACHRDFMARNLIPTRDGGLSVIDFQDVRMGPAPYDLASLLNDSLYPPQELQEALLATFSTPAWETLDYHRCAAQRALKIVGTFVGFAGRGFPRYLPMVAPSVERAQHHLMRLPEFEGLTDQVEELATRLLAAAVSL